MKQVKVCLPDGRMAEDFFVPDNCGYNGVLVHGCKAVHHSNPECDCRWCVFNNEYCQAHGESDIA